MLGPVFCRAIESPRDYRCDAMHRPVWKPLIRSLAAAFLAAAFASAHAASAVPKATPAAVTGTSACPTILQKSFRRLQDDAPQDLCQYAGKVILVVNTASYCGFAYQYEGLEKLYAALSAQGLVVLGFPSNDFGAQEPGDSKQIADFCFNTYGVKFPMFEKSSVKGPDANSLFKDLIKAADREPKWNFYKYLIDRKGRVIESYSSLTNPDNKQLQADIQRALAQK